MVLLAPSLALAVVNAPTANTVAAAEHGIALLCALARNVPQVRVSGCGCQFECQCSCLLSPSFPLPSAPSTSLHPPAASAPLAPWLPLCFVNIFFFLAPPMHLAQADAAMKAGRWERNKWVGVSMVGKTLAIMGFGKVGSEVARRAKGERLGAQLMLVSAATCLYTLGFLFILLRLEGWM